jgi:hypothetical protein
MGAGLASAQDPGGWSKAKWGMTEAQLAAAFGRDIVRLNPPVQMGVTAEQIRQSEDADSAWEQTKAQLDEQSRQHGVSVPPRPAAQPKPKQEPNAVDVRLAIQPVDIDGAQFRALLIPDKVGKLDSVQLCPIHNADATDARFQSLEQLLVQKYGRPWSTKDSISQEFQWTRGQTVISLTLVHLPFTGGTSLTILYKLKPPEPNL